MAAFAAFPVIGIFPEGISPIIGVHPEPLSVTVRCYRGNLLPVPIYCDATKGHASNSSTLITDGLLSYILLQRLSRRYNCPRRRRKYGERAVLLTKKLSKVTQ